MCGRVDLSNPSDFKSLADDFAEDLDYEARFNVAPGAEIPAIRLANSGRSELVMLRWGLLPKWAKDEKFGFKTFNARAEGVAEKPSFREAFRKRRCVLPVNGFYEWFRADKKSPARAFRFAAADAQPLMLAGLWGSWINQDTGEVVESTTIITRPSEAPMNVIHHRMPIILSTDDAQDWMRGSGDGHALLNGANFPLVTMDEVSTYVSNSRNQGAECVERSPGLTEKEESAISLGWSYSYRMEGGGPLRTWISPEGEPAND